jgi:hypothetical protein
VRSESEVSRGLNACGVFLAVMETRKRTDAEGKSREEFRTSVLLYQAYDEIIDVSSTKTISIYRHAVSPHLSRIVLDRGIYN